MALNFGQLAFFSEAKAYLRSRQHLSSPQAQTLAASALAGLAASLMSLPFDFVKTRLQRGGSGGQSLTSAKSTHYRSMLHCFRTVAREEGLATFYTGFGTYYLRIAPHA